MEEFSGGDNILKRAVLVPVNGRWLREPAMKDKLARADEWMRQNSPRETNLDALDSKLIAGS